MQKKFTNSTLFSRVCRLAIKAAVILGAGLALFTLTGCSLHLDGMLNPKGIVAFEERKLFFDTMALMLIVVLPVIVMSFVFTYHYQVSHRTRDYKPNWSHSYFLEALWWGIPCTIIVILAVLTWKKTQELDPYSRIAGHTEAPMQIQVIALPWKWLFIYPQENIATVNYLVIPVNHQVEFLMTTDNAPMSAFFIPQLGSQIYAMAGMRTRLHLVANQTGVYDGLNTQFNGEGFSEMRFSVHVVQPEQLQQWIADTKKSSAPLTDAAYTTLLNPSIGDKPRFFAGVKPDLFQNTINLYMNTFGTVHPRDNQVKSYSPMKSSEV